MSLSLLKVIKFNLSEVFLYLNEIFGYPERVALVAFLALILGSFASLITYRLVGDKYRHNDGESRAKLKDLGKNIFSSRSKCPACGNVLKIRNLFPLFSWLLQRGKCSFCQTAISVRYPLIEATFLILFLIAYFAFGAIFSSQLLLCFVIVSIMILMCIYDLEHYYIPNLLQYLMAIFVAIFLIHQGGSDLLFSNVKSAFLGLIFGVAVLFLFYFMTGIKAIGEDDIKFFFIAGLLVGMSNIWSFFMFSGLFGMIFGQLWINFKDDDTFPFAPAICLSAFICMVYHDFILSHFIGKLLFSQSF